MITGIPPSPPPLPSAFDYLVVAPRANPFLLEWLLPGQVAGAGFRMVTAPRSSIQMRGGNSMHPGDQTNNSQPVGVWHHISVEPREALLPIGTTIDSNIDNTLIQSIGNRASMLKARIKLAMGNGRTRDFDFDIGAGVEFDVKAYAVLEINALVPNPLGPGSTPEGVGLNPFALGTILTTAVYCAPYPQGHKNPLTYSQSFSFEDDAAERGAMPVMPDAREVQLFLDTPVAGGFTAELVFGYAFANPILPTDVTPVQPFVEIGAVQVLPGASSTERVLIPGDANILVVRTGPGTTVATIVQVLNV